MDAPMGEWSDVLFSTDDIQNLCDTVKVQVEKKIGRDLKEYKAVFYRLKNIFVLHYIIKVYVGDDYLHLWVTKSVSTGELIIDLKGVQQHHKWDDPLKPFDSNN